MARYIDADALLKSMQRRYDEICDTYGYHDLYASGYDDAVDAVENAPTADVAPRAEWKPVSDPPKKNGRYWVYGVVGGQPLVCVLYFTVRDGFGDDDITHWMPLPEPPKGSNR